MASNVPKTAVTPLPYSVIDVQCLLEECHKLFFVRSLEEVKSVFAEKNTVSRHTVSHTPFTVRPSTN